MLSLSMVAANVGKMVRAEVEVEHFREMFVEVVHRGFLSAHH